MIMIPVVDSEFTDVFPAEFTTTPGADPWVELECPGTIAAFPVLAVAARLNNKAIQAFRIHCLCHEHSSRIIKRCNMRS